MELLLVGDVMLGRLVNQELREESPAYPWGDTLPIFSHADYRVCNLECAITDRGAPWGLTPKVFHFRTDGKNIAVLQRASIDAVTCANNHILDYEYEGMFETFKHLGQAGMACAGAGIDLYQASTVAISEIQAKSIGLLAFTDNEPDWEATENLPGVHYVPIDLQDERAQKLLEIVRRSKENVDYLIVSPHWGPNWGYAPPAEQIPFAHALIDAGADLIFGHSGHIFRGIEFYRGKPILYCAGDFIDDYAVDELERNDESFIFVLETDFARVQRLRLYPTIIEHFQARLARRRESERIVPKMELLCQRFETRTQWQASEGFLAVWQTETELLTKANHHSTRHRGGTR